MQIRFFLQIFQCLLNPKPTQICLLPDFDYFDLSCEQSSMDEYFNVGMQHQAHTSLERIHHYWVSCSPTKYPFNMSDQMYVTCV